MTFSIFLLLNTVSNRWCNATSMPPIPESQDATPFFMGSPGLPTTLPELRWGFSQSRIWSCASYFTSLEGVDLAPQINSSTLPSAAPFSPSSCFLFSPQRVFPKLKGQIQPDDVDPLFQSLIIVTLHLNLHKKSWQKMSWYSNAFILGSWLHWINWTCLSLCDVYS